MLNVEQKQEIIATIHGFLFDAAIDDRVKATKIQNLFEAVNLDTDEVITIVQTNGEHASEKSLMREAIRINLPLSFEALYNAAGNRLCLQINKRADYHSCQNIIGLMEQSVKFSTEEAGGYGPGGILTQRSILIDKRCSWLKFVKEELEIERDSRFAMARVAMVESGVRVGLDTELEYNIIEDEDGKETITCRPANRPQ
jgi:hypothetical protein